MKNLRSLLCLSLVLSCCVVGDASAQQEDNGTFYFPPEFSFSLQAGQRGEKVEDKVVWNSYLIYNTAPLLPILFFDAGSVQPPKRYQLFFNSLETDAFTDTAVAAWNEVFMQHHVLNIIGYRMRELRRTTIELEGGYSTETGESVETAAERAEIVKEYLVNIWKIDPQRIAILPSRRMCDSTDHIFRQEEARCVLIHPNDIALIRPVLFCGTALNTPSVHFSLSIQPNTGAPDDVNSIDIVLKTGDTVLSSTTFEGNSDSALYRLQGIWTGDREQLMSVVELEAYALVDLQNGSTRRTNSIFIPVTKVQSVGKPPKATTDSTFEIYLPFFFPDRGSLSPLQRSLLGDALDSILTDSLFADARFDLSVRAVAEASEDTTTAGSLLYSMWSEYQVLSNRLESSLQKIPKTRPMLFRDAGGSVPDYDGWYYGDEGRSVPQDYRRKSSLANSALGNEGKRLIDSLSMRRGEEVARLLRDHARGARFKEIRVLLQPDPPGKSSDSPPYCFTPEERFYQRQVIIIGRLHREEVTPKGVDAEE